MLFLDCSQPLGSRLYLVRLSKSISRTADRQMDRQSVFYSLGENKIVTGSAMLERVSGDLLVDGELLCHCSESATSGELRVFDCLLVEGISIMHDPFYLRMRVRPFMCSTSCSADELQAAKERFGQDLPYFREGKRLPSEGLESFNLE